MYQIARAFNFLVEIIQILIFIRVIFSYLGDLKKSKFYEIIYQLTEPILGPTRKLLDRFGLNRGMIDFSPIVALLLLYLIRNIVIRILI